MLEGFWRQRFPGQIPDELGIPEGLDGASIELEGHALIPIDTGWLTLPLHLTSNGFEAHGPVAGARHP